MTVYEGGFKLWECAIDLCEYMLAKDLGRPGLLDGANPLDRLRLTRLRAGKRVMELGCGHGLPGILAAQAGEPRFLCSTLLSVVAEGASVDFCDFNHEVHSSSHSTPRFVQCLVDALYHSVLVRFSQVLLSRTPSETVTVKLWPSAGNSALQQLRCAVDSLAADSSQGIGTHCLR